MNLRNNISYSNINSIFYT